MPAMTSCGDTSSCRFQWASGFRLRDGRNRAPLFASPMLTGLWRAQISRNFRRRAGESMSFFPLVHIAKMM